MTDTRAPEVRAPHPIRQPWFGRTSRAVLVFAGGCIVGFSLWFWPGEALANIRAYGYPRLTGENALLFVVAMACGVPFAVWLFAAAVPRLEKLTDTAIFLIGVATGAVPIANLFFARAFRDFTSFPFL